MADIGYIALFLALITAVYAATAFIIGTKRKNLALTQSAGNSLLAICGLVSIAVAILLYALVSHNFRIEYVAAYTSRDMSLTYLISAFWAGNDGSLLFWSWLLSILTIIVVRQRRDVGKELVPYAVAILTITQAFFLFLMITEANPFHKLSFTPADGRGLNPLLENPGMLFHPPSLLTGYVGLSIPFAFAMAALLTGRLGDEWIVTVRRWTLLAWLSLGIGNLIGAWWAYVELGWGGYWAWDPVESASFMPWLTATAFLHSIMMQRRRGILKIWNMVLVTLTFSLSIFGTFLTRSGILTSVHTFGESGLGPFFAAFILIALFGSLGLVFYRSEALKSEAEMESFVSRESTFLLNNLLLVGVAFATFLGTVFPVLSEAVRGVKISVGPPFFNQVNGPILLAVILLAGICTLIGWRRASVRNLMRNFLWPLVAAVVLGIILFIVGVREKYALLVFPACGFVAFTIFSEWLRGSQARHHMKSENYLKAFWNLIGANRPRYGGYIVHLGIVLMAIGVAGSSLYGAESEATIKTGESMSIRNYTLNYDNIDTYETESKQITTTTLSVFKNGKQIGQLFPEKILHRSYDQPVTEVAIRTNLREDLYIILVSWSDDGSTVFKVLVNPLVSWIWIGGLFVVAGGLVAFWPESRKRLTAEQTEGRGG